MSLTAEEATCCAAELASSSLVQERVFRGSDGQLEDNWRFSRGNIQFAANFELLFAFRGSLHFADRKNRSSYSQVPMGQAELGRAISKKGRLVTICITFVVAHRLTLTPQSR
jgi:hypothetical protein